MFAIGKIDDSDVVCRPRDAVFGAAGAGLMSDDRAFGKESFDPIRTGNYVSGEIE